MKNNNWENNPWIKGTELTSLFKINKNLSNKTDYFLLSFGKIEDQPYLVYRFSKKSNTIISINWLKGGILSGISIELIHIAKIHTVKIEAMESDRTIGNGDIAAIFVSQIITHCLNINAQEIIGTLEIDSMDDECFLAFKRMNFSTSVISKKNSVIIYRKLN